MFQPTKEWVNKVNLSSFWTRKLFQSCACVISARKAKQLDATTMFTYSHANTPLGQSERAYYLSYLIKIDLCRKVSPWICIKCPPFLTFVLSPTKQVKYKVSSTAKNYALLFRDRGGGGAGRAIALPLYCWDLFSSAPVDTEKIRVELLDFALWKSGVFPCPNYYNQICMQG